MAPWAAVLAWIAFTLLAPAPALHAGGGSVSGTVSEEYRVKAAFLFNFARYVHWPAEAFVDDDAPIVVAVYGDDPFGSALVDALAGKQIEKRRFVIERITGLDKLRPVHLLFVPDSSEREIGPIVEHYAGTSTLIVGDSMKTVEANGSIGFYFEQKKLRFAINAAAIKRCNLEVSSQLLKLAHIVGDKGTLR